MHSFRFLTLVWALVWGQVFPVLAQEDFDMSHVQIEGLLEKSASSPLAGESVVLARRALSLSVSSRNKLLQLRSHRAMAEANLRLDEPDTAIVHLLAAAKLAEKIGGRNRDRAEIFTTVGDIFSRMEMFGNAIPYYDSVLFLQPQNHLAREKKGDALLSDGKINEASQVYDPVIEAFFAAGELARAVDIYQKLADACNRAGDTERGVSFYLLIQGIIERIGTPAEKGRLYNNMGYQYYLARDYEAAVRSLEKAKLQCQYANCQNPELHLINLGIVLHNRGDSKRGIENLLSAREILTPRKDRKAMAALEHLIAKTYFGANDFYNALVHNNLAIRYARESKQHDIWRNAAKTAAELHLELYDHETAINYYRDYLRLDDSLRRADQDKNTRLLKRQSLLERTEKNTQLNLRENTIRELYDERVRQEEVNLLLANSRLSLMARQKQDSLLLLQRQQQITESEARERAAELLRINQELQFQAKQRAAEQQVADLRRQEELDRAHREAKDSIADRELRIYQQRAEIADLQIRQQESFRRYAYILGILGAVILGLLGFGWLLARRTGQRLREQNRRIEAQKSLIESERAKSDSLLRNILPEEIANELKAAGGATPRQYEQVTVVFTDFVNFTKLSERLSPEQLISELDECFLAFDGICEKYGLEKIKTIGDAYMCAGGVPVANRSNAYDAVNAALEMGKWLDNRNRNNADSVFREMRIGIHTGQVIAGVIGKNKFAYDIWGDAVNLAARLEELGEPGRINISGTTFHLIKDRFRCVYRGKKEVHNKGLVDMYFVEEAAFSKN